MGGAFFFIGPKSDQLAALVTNSLYSLTDCCLVDFTDVALAFEDANPKLLDVVSIADVVAKKRVDNSFVKILKLKFGTDFEPEYLSNESEILFRF